EPTNEEYTQLATYIFEFRDGLLAKVRRYPQILQQFLKQNIIKFVENKDNVSTYLEDLRDRGLI
ncbi:MAG: hypothetical protein ACXAE3_14195, partial [Candidatus Kariarchaeaceae archaeon]